MDGKFGTPDPSTGKWSGAVSMLMREEADWSLGGFIVNSPRFSVISYARIPFTMIATGLNFLTALPEALPPWLSVVWPFYKEVWAAYILAVVLFGPVAFAIMSGTQRATLLGIYGWMANAVSGRGSYWFPLRPDPCEM